MPAADATRTYRPPMPRAALREDFIGEGEPIPVDLKKYKESVHANINARIEGLEAVARLLPKVVMGATGGAEGRKARREVFGAAKGMAKATLAKGVEHLIGSLRHGPIDYMRMKVDEDPAGPLFELADIIGFHGTPKKPFTKFKDEYLLTGEGAFNPDLRSEFGLGHYFSESPAVGKAYQKTLSDAELARRLGDVVLYDDRGVFRDVSFLLKTRYRLHPEHPDWVPAGRHLMNKYIKDRSEDAWRFSRSALIHLKDKPPALQWIVDKGRTALVNLDMGSLERLRNSLESLKTGGPASNIANGFIWNIQRSVDGLATSRRLKLALPDVQKAYLATSPGSFYKANLKVDPETELLDLDKRIMEQPKAVLEKLEKSPKIMRTAMREPGHKEGLPQWLQDLDPLEVDPVLTDRGVKGKTLLKRIENEYDPARAAEIFGNLGIKGHYFLSGEARKKGFGPHNIVISPGNENAIQILEAWHARQDWAKLFDQMRKK